MVECGQDNSGTTLVAVLLFKREELVYDIANMAWVEGHILPRETDDELRHTLQDVAQEGNIDRVDRILNKAQCILTELLYPYTKREVATDCLDDRLRSKEVYGVRLELPEDFSQTTLNLMEELAHEYFVADVVQDWLLICNPPKAAMWVERRDIVKEQLRRAVNNRRSRKRLRLRLSPF